MLAKLSLVLSFFLFGAALSLPITTTLSPNTETVPFEVTLPSTTDSDITTQTISDEDEEPLILNLDQVVIGFKLSMDPEEVNKISKRQTADGEPNEQDESNTTVSLKDLEDSFGGLNEEATEKPRPPERKSGFYYLVDWNSFFELDDQLGTRVNLRIQPKLGNPARFIPVTVP